MIQFRHAPELSLFKNQYRPVALVRFVVESDLYSWYTEIAAESWPGITFGYRTTGAGVTQPSVCQQPSSTTGATGIFSDWAWLNGIPNPTAPSTQPQRETPHSPRLINARFVLFWSDRLCLHDFSSPKISVYHQKFPAQADNRLGECVSQVRTKHPSTNLNFNILCVDVFLWG